jgi:HKD family nuclease
LRVLRAVQRDQQFPLSPEIGLGVPWLFTAGKGSPSLLQEIRRELASSDQVDILVSFITVSGVRKLQDVLQQITAKGAQQMGSATKTRLRILTTTYTGATEARALDELARLPGCEVRVSLDGRRTRLHAKAWLFQRKTGFGSAYVGSANLSGAALTGGLEWTVKLTQRAQEALFARAVAHFETLWADSEFQRYDPDNVEHRQALAAALGRESFGGGARRHDQLFRPAAQDLPAGNAGAVDHRARPRSNPKPAGGGHRHGQDGGGGVRLPEHLPH